MEKRSPLFYLVQFFLVLLAIFFFGAGTSMIIAFIRNDNSISFSTVIGVSYLGAVVFIAGYFVWMFAFPPLHKISGWARAAGIIWGLGMLLVPLYILTSERLINLLLAIVMYSWAGATLAWASNRFRTVLKT